jgi:hypothetical protein
MSGSQITRVILGLCVASVGGSARADASPFVGRWHLNRAESTIPPGKPGPMDVTAEILRADSTHMRWSITVPAAQGQPSVETFDTPANGEFYPISNDTTAAFRLTASTVHATFKGPADQTDTQTCTLANDKKKMICKGILNNGQGRTMDYVDVYDRI